MLRTIGWGVLGLIVLAAFLPVSAIGYRAWRQREGAAAMAITTPNGIDEAGFVAINGTQQWITVRGVDRDNPVLLVLHGLGGASSVFAPYTYEADFTVAHWDQPGAGRTFGLVNGLDSELSIEDVVHDGIAVAEHLRTRLGVERIGLIGNSWGSVVGVHMVKQRPDLFYAYVGAGQVSDMARGQALGYAFVLQKARDRDDQEAVEDLEAIGPPPYDALYEMQVVGALELAYDDGGPTSGDLLAGLLLAPGYTLDDARDWAAGLQTSQDHFFGRDMKGPLMAVDLFALGPEIDVPVVLYQGTDDVTTPYALATEYFDFIDAPSKHMETIDGAGHFAMTSRQEQFADMLRQRVRPLAQ